jgi:hypothetical protein
MRKHNILFFLALLFLVACIDSRSDGIIEQDEMVNLLVDVHIVDGSMYNIDSPHADSLYKYGIDRYVKVFKKHKTDSTQFDKSLKYYSLHPEQLEEMYTVVSQKLKAKLDSINNQPVNRPKKNALPKK